MRRLTAVLISHLSENKKAKGKVFRPVKELSDNIIPLAHSYNYSSIGRGFLIHTGISLDEEENTKFCLTLFELSIGAYQMLARPYNRISSNI